MSIVSVVFLLDKDYNRRIYEELFNDVQKCISSDDVEFIYALGYQDFEKKLEAIKDKDASMLIRADFNGRLCGLLYYTPAFNYIINKKAGSLIINTQLPLNMALFGDLEKEILRMKMPKPMKAPSPASQQAL